jgi:aspartate racemase
LFVSHSRKILIHEYNSFLSIEIIDHHLCATIMTFPSPLIGILGGMGPQAGLDMADKLIAMTRTQCDQDHIPFVLFSLPESVPDRTSYLLGKTSTNPAYAIADQFEKMSSMGVSIAVMACNTAHAGPIFDVALELMRARGAELRILHLIRETVTHIRENHPDIRRVGILGTQGTYQTRLYDQALEDVDLEVVLPDPDVREHDIHAALYAPSFGIKTCPGEVTKEASTRIRKAIQHLQSNGAEAVILGCTELPLAVKDDQINGMPILDPAKIIAEKLIRETYPDKLA